MARYIDLDKAIERLNASPAFGNMGADGYFLLDVVKDLLNRLPTLNVAIIKHARWIGRKGRDYYTCSNCCAVTKSKDDEYCRHCGARMDGGKQNDRTRQVMD